jgi:hypothetical protein
MDRREFLRSLAAFGVALPTGALGDTPRPRSLYAAIRRLDGTGWWLPVLRAWRDGEKSAAIDAFCTALEVPTVYDMAEIDVAVARLLLGAIQDSLPAWRLMEDGEWSTARPPFPRHRDRTPVFRPRLAVAINWASSGPGFDWPESYFVTHVTELGIHVVTASRDSEDAFGVTDHAIGHRPDSLTAIEAARQLIEADWRRRRDEFDQAAWEAFDAGGLLGGEAEQLREAVWSLAAEEDD